MFVIRIGMQCLRTDTDVDFILGNSDTNGLPLIGRAV